MVLPVGKLSIQGGYVQLSSEKFGQRPTRNQDDGEFQETDAYYTSQELVDDLTNQAPLSIEGSFDHLCWCVLNYKVYEGTLRTAAEPQIPVIPRIQQWRLNLTALSQAYNLFFAAFSHALYVYRPRSANTQLLPAKADLIIYPRMPDSPLHTTGHHDEIRCFDANNMAVGFLGRHEVLVTVHDNGAVVVYATVMIERYVRYLMKSGGQRPAEEDGIPKPRPLFTFSVDESAWGIAIHPRSRLIAVTSNRSEIHVFVTPDLDSYDFLSDNAPENIFDPEGGAMHHGHEVLVFPLRRCLSNMPTIEFLENKNGLADTMVVGDIRSGVFQIRLWESGTNIMGMMDTHMSLMQLGQTRVWSLAALPEHLFVPCNKSKDALIGNPQFGVQPSAFIFVPVTVSNRAQRRGNLVALQSVHETEKMIRHRDKYQSSFMRVPIPKEYRIENTAVPIVARDSWYDTLQDDNSDDDRQDLEDRAEEFIENYADGQYDADSDDSWGLKSLPDQDESTGDEQGEEEEEEEEGSEVDEEEQEEEEEQSQERHPRGDLLEGRRSTTPLSQIPDETEYVDASTLDRGFSPPIDHEADDEVNDYAGSNSEEADEEVDEDFEAPAPAESSSPIEKLLEAARDERVEYYTRQNTIQITGSASYELPDEQTQRWGGLDSSSVIPNNGVRLTVPCLCLAGKVAQTREERLKWYERCSTPVLSDPPECSPSQGLVFKDGAPAQLLIGGENGVLICDPAAQMRQDSACAAVGLQRGQPEFSNMCMRAVIGELSLIVVGNGAGDVVLLTPTRLLASGKPCPDYPSHAFRTEMVLPLARDGRLARRATRKRLVGMACSPVFDEGEPPADERAELVFGGAGGRAHRAVDDAADGFVPWRQRRRERLLRTGRTTGEWRLVLYYDNHTVISYVLSREEYGGVVVV